jgi:transposase
MGHFGHAGIQRHLSRPLFTVTTTSRLRNLVERCFNKLKNARCVATHDDKTAESFVRFIDIASIRLWLRHLSI